MQPELATPEEIIAYLEEYLGPRVTMYLADAPLYRFPPGGLGAEPVEPRPKLSPESLERLRTGYRVFRRLAEVDSGGVVRAWFVGMNPELGDVSPTAIRDGRLRDVSVAAQAFVVGG